MQLNIKKGFTLIEVLMAALLVSITACGVTGAVAVQKNCEKKARERLYVITKAQLAADKLNYLGDNVLGDNTPWNLPSALSLGQHNSTTDPDICLLPQNMEGVYNAELIYTIETVNVLTKTKLTRATITVSWSGSKDARPDKFEELITFPLAV